MRRLALGCWLLTLAAAAPMVGAQENGWQRDPTRPPLVILGRPITVTQASHSDREVQRASYTTEQVDESVIMAGGQATGAPPPPAPPPGTGVMPVSPEERFNCGVVMDPPGTGHFLNKGTRGWWEKCRDFCGGLFVSDGGTPRARFQSDHGFDGMISPVTNPFLFEDPRSLTELRPVIIVQGAPSGSALAGGNIEYLGLQGRLAFTERLSLVVTEFGWIWVNPASDSAFDSANGATELRIGPKYTFYRCEPTGTVAAAGLLLNIPVGSSEVFQHTGDLSLQPFLSVGQTFGRSTWGSFNFMGTLGYSAATDDERTDYLYTSLHLDYDVGNLRKFYPLLEFSYFNYTDAGNATPFDFEGRDLFNFGASGVQGNDTITMAVGMRYKLSEFLQFGGAYEFPVSGNRDLLDYRLTFDLIFRY